MTHTALAKMITLTIVALTATKFRVSSAVLLLQRLAAAQIFTSPIITIMV